MAFNLLDMAQIRWRRLDGDASMDPNVFRRTVEALRTRAMPDAALIDIAVWLWLYQGMKTIAAGKFKDICLKTLDEVAETRNAVVITKRGRPVARLVPYVEPLARKGLVGSVLDETDDPFTTGEPWDADAD